MNIGELANPHAQKPNSVGSPIPATNSMANAPAPGPGIAPGKISMPPMTIQGGEPARAPSGEASGMTPEEQALLNAPDQGAPSGGMTPEEQALIAAPTPESKTDLSESGNTYGGLGDTQPELSGPHLVRLPDGSYGMSQPGSKQITDVSPTLKTAAKYMAHALRMGGPGIGAVLAEAIPGAQLIGPFAPAAGATLGGKVVHPAINTLEAIAGERPSEYGLKEATINAVAGGAGKYIGKLGEALVNPAGKSFGAETAALAKTGEQTLTQEAAQRTAAAKEAGIPISKEEAALELVGGSKALAKVGRDQEIVNKFEELKGKIGPKVTPEQAKDFSTETHFDDIRKMHEKNISNLKSKAYLASGDAKLPDLGLQSKAAIDGVLNERSAEPPKAVSDFLDKIGAQGGKGASHRDVDRLLTTLGDEANFRGTDRTGDQRVAGEIYHKVAEARNAALEKTFKDAGQESNYQAIKSENEFYSKNREVLKDFQTKYADDPSMLGAARLIAKNNNAKELSNFLDLMPDEKRAQFQRLMGEEILGNPTRKNIGAAQMSERLNALDHKNRDLIFGDNLKDVQTLVNAAKVIESAPTPPTKNGAIAKAVKRLVFSKYAPVKRFALVMLDNMGWASPATTGSKVGAAVGAAAGGAMSDLQGR